MSSLSDQADIQRILSREQELEVRYSSYATVAPHTAPDTAYFDYVGRQFPSRKGSYPNDVEISGDEAAVVQPDATTRHTHQSYQLQRSSDGGLQYNSPPTPTLTPTQKTPYISAFSFEEIRRQRSIKKRNPKSTRSNRTRKSTPTPTREPSPSTSTGPDDHFSAVAAYHDHTPAASFAFSESHTPSHCSLVTEDGNPRNDGVDPSSPHPYSAYAMYHPHEGRGAENAWQRKMRH